MLQAYHQELATILLNCHIGRIVLGSMCVGVSVWLGWSGVRVAGWSSNTDTTPTSHTETPTHIETRTQNQCVDMIGNSQAPDDGCINVRNVLSIEEVK